MREILVTSALPYANGYIHLGHLVEYIQTDIWVRAMKAQGHQVTYVCADDAHGTAIMLKAEANGVTPEEQIASVKASHEADFAKFLIDFDNYHSTHSEENKHFSELIYRRLNSAGHISTKDVKQLFDPEKQLFLADRFVKGECPECGALDQYGDNCEACGTTYDATDLINPHSTLSNATPVLKTSKHYFFDLPEFEQFLKDWTRSENRLQVSVANKLQEWFDAGLTSWDISRDAPYFGFQIPDTPSDEPEKYFYVWLDAPVGYMASFKNLCDKREGSDQALDFDRYWMQENEHKTEVYHFIGKDIVYFHALFWPAMLEGAGFRTPTAINAHGFLTVNGEKMSKSRGTFIKADTYLQNLDPEYLRYYFASKLSASVEDINLDLEDFMQKVNSDLVGKVVNIASRCAGFIHKNHGSKLALTISEPALVQQIIDAGEDIAAAYEAREFSKAMRLIMACADKANEYIDDKKPWALNKVEGQQAEVQAVCTVALNIFRQLVVYLAPVLPLMCEKARIFLNVDSLDFDSRHALLVGHTINAFTPLMQRVDKDKVAAMVDASKEDLNKQPSVANQAANGQADASKTKAAASEQPTDANALIGIDDFAKVTMTVAKVLACNNVEGADKLLQFTLDVGETDAQGNVKTRNVFSGIAKFYNPEQLVGKTVVCVTNLAPRKMKFGISEGMILSAEKAGQLTVVTLDDHIPAGATLA